MVANYGNKKRSFRVDGIDTNLNPIKYKFTYKEKLTTLKDYMKYQYDKYIKDDEQPLFYNILDNGSRNYYAPELCCIEGIPDEVRANKGSMRKILKDA